MSPSILLELASGSPGAMQRCMDRFGGLVWSLARRQTSGGADADDAVQEIFIDVWRSAGRFDPTIASETTFIAMIARRRLIDRGRRRARRPEVAAIPETIESDGPAFDPAEVEEAAKAANQPARSASVSGVPALIFAMFSGGWNTSASSKVAPVRWAASCQGTRSL
jgi:RNA polymerase sigma-70 factor (ECF subfamily)